MMKIQRVVAPSTSACICTARCSAAGAVSREDVMTKVESCFTQMGLKVRVIISLEGIE